MAARRGARETGLAVAATFALSCSSSSSTASGAPGGADAGHDAGIAVTAVALPSGAPGIAFDDLRYAPVIKKVLAPAGRTGDLDLVDPSTSAVTAISGFTASTTFTVGGHSSGCTSADEGQGVIFAIDHESQSVRVVDEATNAIVASGPLAASPDYVRWVASTSEVWVTEPGTGIEVLTTSGKAAPAHAATIAVAGGPEAIAVDATRHRVYTNSFTGKTFAVDVPTRALVETWTNGCTSLSLGLALDEQRGFLAVACSTGTVNVLDVANAGKKLGSVTPRSTDLDILSYSPTLHHLYVPGGTSAEIGIVAISAAGVPSLLGLAPTAQGSTEVVADDQGHAWVADQGNGRLLRVDDPFPATP
jgi:hypothetical protein